MARGKSISLYLMDGDPNGRMKCTLANWTGLVYRIPRTQLDSCDSRDDLKYTGIYFLFGEDDSGKPNVYIGQSASRKNGEGTLGRLKEHRRDPNKDYWNQAVVVTTSNNSFGHTEICYLEHRFTQIARDANRYTVKNANDPNPGNITEEKQAELEDFITEAKLVMSAMGFKCFESLAARESDVEKSPVLQAEEPLLFLRSTRGGENIESKGRQSESGFVVLAGSRISTNLNYYDRPFISAKIRDLRNMAKVSKDGVLQEDLLFSSPSAAGSFVTGSSINGKEAWKDEKGRSINQIELG